MRLEPYAGPPIPPLCAPEDRPPELVEWMALNAKLNGKARAGFARRQARIGRPVPKSANDPRPDPGTLDCDETEEG